MMKVKYLPISKENIKLRPDYFAIEIDTDIYVFVIRWNETGKFFAFDLYNDAGEEIILGRRIVYGSNMLANSKIENFRIIPLSKVENSEAKRTGITFSNFIDDVRPYIVGGSND